MMWNPSNYCSIATDISSPSTFTFTTTTSPITPTSPIRRLTPLVPILAFETFGVPRQLTSSSEHTAITDTETNHQGGNGEAEDTALVNGHGLNSSEGTINPSAMDENMRDDVQSGGPRDNQLAQQANGTTPSAPNPVVRRVHSDVVNQPNMNAVLVKKQAPSFLIIESLVWTLCSAFEKEDGKRYELFIGLCKSLANFKVLGSSYLEESLQPLRVKISSKFYEEIYRLRTGLLHDRIGLATCASCLLPSPTLNVEFLSTEQILKSQWEANRYNREFEELEVIARGGFGIVKKARHRFDNCIYAVKEIAFPYKSYHNFVQIIREVKLYANLQPHLNVVNYKTAWIQNWICKPIYRRQSFSRTRTESKTYQQARFEEIEEESDGSTSNSSDNLRREIRRLTEGGDSAMGDYDLNVDLDTPRSRPQSDKSDDFVSFEASQQTIERNGASARENDVEGDEAEDEEEEDCNAATFGFEEDETRISVTGDNLLQQQHCSLPNGSLSRQMTLQVGQSSLAHNGFLETTDMYTHSHRITALLYIQMELCGINLRTYLDNRNFEINRKLAAKQDTDTAADPLDFIETDVECHHFEQILAGVEYIHSQNMIHRDLKPQNILFSLDRKRLKIGDFGLATLHQQQQQQHADSNDASLAGAHSAKQLHVPLQTLQKFHTTGLGTITYAAPEQRNGYHISYDHRVDIYSLGIILFELFFPVVTEMERASIFTALKDHGELPSNFTNRWPRLAELIFRLTNSSAHKRPNSVSEIAFLFKHSFSSLDQPLPTDTFESDQATTTSTFITATSNSSSLSPSRITQVLEENHQLKQQLADKDKLISELKQKLRAYGDEP